MMFEVIAERAIGQKLYDLGDGQWDIPELRRLLEEIVPTASTVEAYDVEHDFPDIGRKIMRLNARKVVTPDDRTQFFVLAIDDVTDAVAAQRHADRASLLAQSIVDTVRDPIVILEHDLTVVTASRAFLNLFGNRSGDVEGRRLEDLGSGQWNVDALTKLLSRVVPDDIPLNDYLLEDEFPGLGRRMFKINARKVYRSGDHVTRLLVYFEDATKATAADRHRDTLAAELAHRIKNSLQIISAFVSFEIRQAAEPCVVGYRAMQARINAVAELYDVIASSTAFGPVYMPNYLSGIASSLRSSLLGEASEIVISVVADALDIDPDHAIPMGLLANELATNAVKYAFPSGTGKIEIGFRHREDGVVLTVHDNGIGIGAAPKGGTGMGSRFVTAFAKQLGGSVATASGSTGTTVTVRFPESILAVRLHETHLQEPATDMA
jgi:two-component sensor histidine kinase